MMIKLPEAHLRLSRHPNLTNGVVALAMNEPVMQAFYELLRMGAGIRDDFEIEGRFFRWLLALERQALEARHPDRPRRIELERVRKLVLDRLETALDVSELAALYQMSRSHFTHWFRDVTGRAPGSYIREIRLEAAAERLQDGKLSVKEIAAATGFRDANRFCKAFRQSYQLSPGEYRRLAGSSP